MAESIQPFHRTGEPRSVRQRRPRALPLFLIHFGLAGIALLLAAAGLFFYLYTLHFTYLDIGWDLRITSAGNIYDSGVQLMTAGAVLLAVMSLIQFVAFRALSIGSTGALRAARSAAVTLLLGFPLAYLAWGLEPDLPGISISTAQTAVRALAVLVAVQSVFALIYTVYFALPGARRVIHRDLFAEGRRTPRTWAGIVLAALWALALITGGVALAVMTDVIELPVERPEAGALLYATSFEGEADAQEWGLYEGRDSAQIVAVEPLLTEDAPPGARGQALAISHGSPATDEVIFSALDRKFTDMDLRVTAHMIDGPEDNQYGVVFRYRDQSNYYAFFISGDGYYRLVKRENGVQRDLSTWGTSGAVVTGKAANAIRVIAEEDSFRFFVNGQPMPLCLPGENVHSMWNPATGACATSDTAFVYRDADFAQGGVALAAGSSIDLSGAVVIAFDDLIIAGPLPETFTAEPEGESSP